MKKFLSLITLALFGLSINAQVVSSFPTEESFEDGIADQEFVYTADGWEIIGMGMPGSTTTCPISQGVASSHYICSYNHNSTTVTRELKSMYFQLGGKDNAKLSFYYANPAWSSDVDELEISIRFNGNDTPTSVWRTTEAHNSWTYVEVSLPVNQNYVQLQFKATNHYGYGVFLDRMRVEAWNNNSGDGTDFTYGSNGTAVFSDVPASSIWNYTFSEMIYNYSYMPSPGMSYDRINSISFYYMGPQAGGIQGFNRYVDIYMKNVTRTDFSDGQIEPITQDHLVYSGYISAFAEGWMTIELDRPFYYKNYSGNHMMIAVDDNTGSQATRGYFKGNTTTNGCIRHASDTENPNPFTVTTGTSFNMLPNLKINYDYLQPADVPYFTDFEDDEFGLWYGPWMLKNTTGDGYANWYFQGALGKYDYPTLMCGVNHSMTYNTDNHRETVLAERLVRLSQADSLEIKFNVTVGGESGTYYFDFVMAFLAPASVNWEPVSGGTTYPEYVGTGSEWNLPYALHFGEGLAGTKLVNKDEEDVSTVIPNPGKGQIYKLIFAWSNDPSGGNGTCAAIDDISITNRGGDGVEENVESVLSVMPNPANDVIRVNGLNGTEEVNIYNTLGQVVKSARLSDGESLNISDLSAGVYMLRSENSTEVVKFTVK